MHVDANDVVLLNDDVVVVVVVVNVVVVDVVVAQVNVHWTEESVKMRWNCYFGTELRLGVRPLWQAEHHCTNHYETR